MPRFVHPEKIKKIRELVEKGVSKNRIKNELKVSPHTVDKYAGDIISARYSSLSKNTMPAKEIPDIPADIPADTDLNARINDLSLKLDEFIASSTAGTASTGDPDAFLTQNPGLDEIRRDLDDLKTFCYEDLPAFIIRQVDESRKTYHQ